MLFQLNLLFHILVEYHRRHLVSSSHSPSRRSSASRSLTTEARVAPALIIGATRLEELNAVGDVLVMDGPSRAAVGDPDTLSRAGVVAGEGDFAGASSSFVPLEVGREGWGGDGEKSGDGGEVELHIVSAMMSKC